MCYGYLSSTTRSMVGVLSPPVLGRWRPGTIYSGEQWQKTNVMSGHRVGIGQSQHKLPMVFVCRTADQQVLGCRFNIPQTPLQCA